MLPNVRVNVDEQSIISNNQIIPFVPAVIMKTKSGPIGTIETITSEAQFKAIFGESDYTTPSAFAIQTYLRSYAYVLVTRVANTTAANFGTASMKYTVEETNHNLIKAETKYKTDLFNGKEIKLDYDSTNHKMWLDVSSITGKNTISIKETYVADSATIVDLETVIEKLCNSINISDLGIVLSSDIQSGTTVVPTVAQLTTGITATIQGGDSGNTTNVSASDVNALIDLYDAPERDIDVMVIPEYVNYEVVNHATTLADKNNFVVLVTPTGITPAEVKQSITNYNKTLRGSLALYYPNVFYSGLSHNGSSVAIPSSIAVLHTYAKTDINAKWGAPAGVQRGTLTLATGIDVNLSEDQISDLYDNDTPVNCINNISGKGLIVWGNKTTTSTSSFFDRINVARLVKFITKKAYDVSWRYLFEPITSDLFTRWELALEGVLDPIKTAYGLSDYIVVVDDTINTPTTIANNQLNAIIKIKPQEVAEFITIDLTLTDTIDVSIEE